MAGSSTRPSLTQALLRPEMVERLRERFRYIQENLTTTIHDAADLTQLSESQLRYAELRGLLRPQRSSSGALSDSSSESAELGGDDDIGGSGELRPRGQRRYSAQNLMRAHLIASFLDQGFSLTEIATFMQNNEPIIQEVLETSTLRVKTALAAADDIVATRFIIPRLLNFALALLFERNAVDDAGVIFPVRPRSQPLSSLRTGPVEAASHLYQLGHVAVAWRARGRPLTTFITAGNPFEPEQQLAFVSLESLLRLSDTSEPSTSVDDAPISAYIVCERSVADELSQTSRGLKLRLDRDRMNGVLEPANPRVVASRLIRYVQRLYCDQDEAEWRSSSGATQALFYNSPDMVNPTLGDALLNRLADTLVALGGVDRLPADLLERDERASHGSLNGVNGLSSVNGLNGLSSSHKRLVTTPRWRFACVMLPREPGAPLRDVELVVHAQSKESPHRIGVTTTSRRSNGGLTIRAFNSGHVALRRKVSKLDPTVSYVSEEWPIGSAIAVPVGEDSHTGNAQPAAIVYIAAKEPDQFKPNDVLMIRVMGRIIGEIVQTYNFRGPRLSALTDALATPEIVDTYFADFLPESRFVKDLTDIYRLLDVRASSGSSPDARFPYGVRQLTLIGFDINDFSGIQRRQGDRVGRLLTREIGRRLQQRVRSAFNQVGLNARVYRILGDCWYVLVREDSDENRESPRDRAESIRRELSGRYQLHGETLNAMRRIDEQTAHAGEAISVGVRMAGMTFNSTQLHAQLDQAENDTEGAAEAAVIGVFHLIENGVEQANDVADPGARAVWWNVESGRFELSAAAYTADSEPTAS